VVVTNRNETIAESGSVLRVDLRVDRVGTVRGLKVVKLKKNRHDVWDLLHLPRCCSVSVWQNMHIERLCNGCHILSLLYVLREPVTYSAFVYEDVSKSFRTGRLERELQMVQLSATRYSYIAILWVSLVSFTTITLCVASQRIFIVVSVYFVIDLVWKLLDTPSYIVPHLTNKYYCTRGTGTAESV
jgi:hypothetical protein